MKLNLQRAHALRHAIEQCKGVSIASHEYEHDPKTGRLVSKEITPQHEINRLFESEDFKLGWKMGHEKLAEMVLFVLTASNADLVRYAGRPKEVAK